jgi:hypothetical protein
MSSDGEIQPLLRPVAEVVNEQQHGLENKRPEDEFLDDEDNPLYWKKLYKWGIVLLLASMSFTV